MKQYRLYQVDAFTRDKFAGNPAAVVPDANGLSDAQMQAIAREMNVSETAFVFPTHSHGPNLSSEMRVRFFTPTVEVPVCGHATVAAHWVRAHEGAPDGTYTQITKAGPLPITIERRQSSTTRIWMTQMPAVFETPVAEEIRREIWSALGVAASLETVGPVQVVSTGHSKVMVPIASTTELHALKPDLGALCQISERLSCNGFFVFVLADPGEHVLAHGRMFAPAIGIPEDPATGNACGPLGAYLVQHGHITLDGQRATEFTVRQGEAMGRPGQVTVQVRREGDTFVVRIAGEAVLVFSTTLSL